MRVQFWFAVCIAIEWVLGGLRRLHRPALRRWRVAVVERERQQKLRLFADAERELDAKIAKVVRAC